jgi:exodeoxyribonuclease VII large subunit
VIQDILNILSRRFSGFQLLLNPVRVQGAEAASEIARAIDDFNRYKLADVLIVGRGGGSLEDLWPFNERVVAEAVFRSEIPIISAVGHETDFSICDFVADLRAPTPSAAAEMVSIEQKEVLMQLETMRTRLSQTATAAIRTQRGRLSGLTRQPLFASPSLLLAPFEQKLDEIRAGLDRQTMQGMSQIKMRLSALIKQHQLSRPGSRIPSMQRAFEKWGRDIHCVAKQQLIKRRERLEKLSAHLYAIDPRNLLKKGYAIAFSEKGDSVILSRDDVAVGENLQLQLQDGKILLKRLPYD